MLGIEHLKTVAKFGIDLGEKTASILEDGKVSAMEALGYLPVLLSVPGIIEHKDDIVNEFKDLSDAERTELNLYIQEDFDIADDDLEVKIEKSLAAAVAILDLVSAFKKPAA